MKQTFFYILTFICCLSFFSFARQSRKICYNNSSSQPCKLKCEKERRPAKEETGFDFSPFNLFLFSI